MYVGSTFPEIKARYIDTGKLYYVFKDLPILSNHPQAGLAAQAAECAGAQGKYWEMHGKLFAQPQEWDTTSTAARTQFERYADVIGADAVELSRCIDEGRFFDEVRFDIAEATGLGLTGTPAFLINGKLLSGARPPEQFIQVLDRELSQSSNSAAPD